MEQVQVPPTLALALVSVATGVLSPVLGKLSTLLENKYSSLTGVGDEILELQDELSSMNALLLKLSDIDDLDIQVKEWRNQIRELSYEIEDCIDDFVHRVEQRDPEKRKKMKGFFQESIHKLRTLGARSEIASKILKLKARVDHASERRKRYNFDGVPSSSSMVVPIDPRLPALYAEAESLVGIDGPRDELIERLAEGEANLVRKLKVVSVVGLGGLGKTTLSRQVYDRIGRQFDCRAFVSVSQKPDMRKILRNILTSVTGIEHYPGIEACDEEQLINKLRGFLNDKRYFVVIDDIWSTVAWPTIRCALLENNLCSRILTTTRITSVARSCCSPDYSNVYEMKPLSDINAGKLFAKRIFGSEDQCPSQFKDLSNDILRKCGGLPLAVISIASLLASKPCTKEQWESYRNHIGSALEDVPSVSNMQKIISLSYNDLPHYLKTCLLYLSMFPEDFVIPRDQLVRRWIAEGFISTCGGQRLEQVGECYYNELINRSMIMPATQEWDRRAVFCRVHDVILDLIVSKSAEEKFVTAVGNNNHTLGPQDKACRLSLDCRDQDNIVVSSSMVLSKARSFSIYGSSEHTPLLSDFQALRVINIEQNRKLENHYFDDIGRLVQLKYLTLQEVNISKLPDQIGELQQLESLELRWTGIKELPKNIVRLKKLKFLYASNVRLFEGIGNMQALQEVRYVKVDSSIPTTSLDELGNLAELRYLGIDWLVSDSSSDQKSYTDSFVSCMDRLCRFKLRYLNIACDVENGISLDFLLDSWSPPPCLLENFVMRSAYYFPRIPEWASLLSNVTLLDININPVRPEVLQVLGCLPSLLSLSLYTREVAPGATLIICSSGFQCLEEFEFYSWNIAMGPLVFEVGAMPKLEKFVFRLVARCIESPCGNFYLGLQHVRSLKHLLVDIDCRGANAEEVQITEAAIKNATDLTINHVRIDFSRLWMDQMAKDDDAGGMEGSEHRGGEGPAESSTKILLQQHFKIFPV
ncbi:hypothetical protein BRADI_2g57534v3 [Brachypodium distachyon]|uniref:NB-ARC domain-containing protein n=2 Tax=Brachypodium distachyon TaxID=15368 RepID=A0A2K2DGG9_BRADI|nr:hypothetical protein BRADI_2g57534v3 [Brachypodium distachyon]PNT73368.1 hypothetical protein BRADI_2g57534v3 [Brachypodium distachyon]